MMKIAWSYVHIWKFWNWNELIMPVCKQEHGFQPNKNDSASWRFSLCYLQLQTFTSHIIHFTGEHQTHSSSEQTRAEGGYHSNLTQPPSNSSPRLPIDLSASGLYPGKLTTTESCFRKYATLCRINALSCFCWPNNYRFIIIGPW